ncbi:hypothetical protein FN846DRAFT_887350 [Sphaerosporella brunnea]|uniref:Uncharacterized protein n=1 Tax=Sphaerosporella brunnea TaxID=1250544 RepID=A0A5J5F5X9_9PEZI|nr:hypothetical protein FN846DRAFT_887350 [Sphaerosporella brunnea]
MNEANSDNTRSGSGDEAAPGLCSNSAYNTPLGEIKDNPQPPLRRCTSVTQTKNIFHGEGEDEKRMKAGGPLYMKHNLVVEDTASVFPRGKPGADGTLGEGV